VPASRTGAEKSRLPKCVFILRTRRSVFSSDRSRSPDAEEWVPMQQSRGYSGAAPWSDRKTSSGGQSLYSVRNGTGSQWRTSRRSGVTLCTFYVRVWPYEGLVSTHLFFMSTSMIVSINLYSTTRIIPIQSHKISYNSNGLTALQCFDLLKTGNFTEREYKVPPLNEWLHQFDSVIYIEVVWIRIGSTLGDKQQGWLLI